MRNKPDELLEFWREANTEDIPHEDITDSTNAERSYYYERLIEFMASQAKQNEFETYKF
jgi:hypothetical protein